VMATPDNEMSTTRVNGRAVRQRSKLAETVARQIEHEILASGWEVGSVVGDEAHLIAQYGISRAVAREAIRLVERHHVAAPRRGRGGGLVVMAPTETSVVESITLFLQVVGVETWQLIDARLLLELLAVRQAVERLTETGISRLRASVAAEASVGICAADKSALHNVIIECAANPVVRLYLDGLIQLMRQDPGVIRKVREDGAAAVPRLPEIHRGIAEAVVAGDVGLAQQRMTAHIKAIGRDIQTAQAAAQSWAQSTAQSATQSTAGSAGPGRPDPLALGGATVARVRASDKALSSILADIQVHAREPGFNLGSEPALLQRYGIARSALREAVRFLEHLGVVEMRRGTAGGLVITEPAPDGLAQTIAMYLEYCRTSSADLRQVRTELELYSVRQVASGMTGHARERLMDILRSERRAGDALVAPVVDVPYQISKASRFHLAIADLSGNHATQVFVRPLIILTSGGSPDADAAALPGARERAASVRRAHQSIAEAVMAGDEEVAAYRMRKHLAAVFVSGAGPGRPPDPGPRHDE
jgi:DNA-binding FadR family transcriptional regulator